MYRVAIIYFVFCYKSPDSEISIKWERNTTLGRFTKYIYGDCVWSSLFNVDQYTFYYVWLYL